LSWLGLWKRRNNWLFSNKEITAVQALAGASNLSIYRPQRESTRFYSLFNLMYMLQLEAIKIERIRIF